MGPVRIEAGDASLITALGTGIAAHLPNEGSTDEETFSKALRGASVAEWALA